MTLGQKIAELRKERKISQNEFGKRVGTSGDIIGRYKRDEVKPSIEVASKIADTLEVSLDYLMGKTQSQVDNSLLKRLDDLSQLPPDAKNQIFMVMDALIRDFKAKQTYS